MHILYLFKVYGLNKFTLHIQQTCSNKRPPQFFVNESDPALYLLNVRAELHITVDTRLLPKMKSLCCAPLLMHISVTASTIVYLLQHLIVLLQLLL